MSVGKKGYTKKHNKTLQISDKKKNLSKLMHNNYYQWKISKMIFH